MTQTVKIPFKGRECDAVRIEANDSKEYWNQYQLSDGSLLRMKAIAAEIFRINGEYDSHGNPVYVVRSGNIVSVIVPEELKKK